MRPPSQLSSHFYHPLDTILATPAAVRIIRVLSLHRGPLSRTDIAQRSGLGRAGTNRALDRLARSGIITVLGASTRPLINLALDHPLFDAIKNLFEAEAERTDAFFTNVREVASTITPAPTAVWLIGSVARGEDTALSDVDLAVVFKDVERAGLKPFTMRVREFATAVGVNVSVVAMTRDELTSHAEANDQWWRNLVADAVPLMGPSPAVLMHE